MKKRIAVMMAMIALCHGGSLAAESHVLDEVFVYGDRRGDEYGTYVGEYVGQDVSVGILGRKPYDELPLSALSITTNAIEQSARPGSTLLDALTLDPQVTSRGGNAYNDINIRGFYVSPHDYLVDGIPGLMCQSSIPTNFLERIDIISGPATLTNGSSSYGKTTLGAVDLIPKKASDTPIFGFTETFSGRSTWSETVDIGKRFGHDKEWGVRINADYTKGTTYRKKEKMTTGNIFIDVDYDKDGTRANFFYGHNHVKEKAPDLPLKIGEFKIPKPPKGSTNFQVSWADYSYTNDFMGLSFEQDFSPHLTWFLKAGYHDEDWYSCFESYYPTLYDDEGNYNSYIEQVPIRIFRKTLTSGFRSEFDTGIAHHTAVLSADKQWASGYWGDWAAGYDYVYYGNIYNDSIEQSVKPNVDKIDWGADQKKISKGLSFLDTVEIRKWSILGGIRHQTEEVSGGYNSSAYSPSFGVMYHISPELSVYGNWMRSLIAGRTVPAWYANKGKYLDPVKTTQKEAGFKWNHKKMGATAAVFYVDQQLAMEDEATNTLGYNGRQKSKGFALTVFGNPSDKWHILGGFSVTNVSNEGGTYDGKHLAAVPKWNATLAADYEVNDQLSFNTRLIYNSRAWVDSMNTRKLPSWTRVDLGAKYTWNKDTNPVVLSVDVINVFGHRYWYGAGNNALYLGTPRTAVVSLGYSF